MRLGTEDGVFALLPFDMRRPDVVQRDGDQGVTRPTFDNLAESVETELIVRLDRAQVSAAMRRHKLVVHAANLLMAAQLCRKMKNFQDQANSFFAEANVKLRLFFDSVAQFSEGQADGEVVLGTEAEVSELDLAGSALKLSVFSGIKV